MSSSWPETSRRGVPALHGHVNTFTTSPCSTSRATTNTTVVVTHHAPSRRSIAPQFAGDSLNAAFASDLTGLMGLPRVPPVVTDEIPAPVTPALWVHGHMHNSSDYLERGTRIVCNPRGYFPYEPNPDFDPKLIIEVPT